MGGSCYVYSLFSSAYIVQGYQRADLITSDELALIKKVDRQPKAKTESLLLSEAPTYALLYLRLLKKLQRVDTMQCILVLIADAIAGASSCRNPRQPPSSPQQIVTNGSLYLPARSKATLSCPMRRYYGMLRLRILCISYLFPERSKRRTTLCSSKPHRSSPFCSGPCMWMSLTPMLLTVRKFRDYASPIAPATAVPGLSRLTRPRKLSPQV